MKKLLVGMLATMMILTGCGTGDSSSGEAKDLSEVKIGVIQLMKHDALDAAYDGFKQVVVDAGVKEDNIEYIVAGDQANCTTVADTLVNGDYDLIYAIATPAAQAVAAATDTTPIVGSAITDYESAGLTAKNITGSSDLNPVEAQFDLMMQLLPETKNIGIMYTGSEDNSIFQGNMAKEAAEARNLTYKVYTTTDKNDIQAVSAQIAADGADCVYIPTDNVLAENIDSVEAILSPAGIPVIAGEENMTAAGGFATYGLNYTNLGKLAGEQAVKILKGEATPADLDIAYLDSKDCTMVINLKVAKNCGITINKEDYPEATFVE